MEDQNQENSIMTYIAALGVKWVPFAGFNMPVRIALIK